MTTPEPAPPSSDPAEFTVQIIWFALLVSHFMYLGMIYFLHMPTQPALPIVPALTAAAILAGVAALVVNGVVLSAAQITKWVSKLKAQGVKDQALETAVMARVQSMSIVCWALAESVTIMGLVLSFTGQLPLNRFLLFVVGGVAIHLYCRPKLAELRKTLTTELENPLFPPLSGNR